MAFFENVPLEVTIPVSETISGGDGKPFTVYCVRISHENKFGEIVSWKAVHKFSHLLNLHDRLKRKYPGETSGMKFPKPISRLDLLEQECRKKGLEEYLQRVVDTPILRRDEAVKAVLLLRERNFTSKYQTLRSISRSNKPHEGDASSSFSSSSSSSSSPSPSSSPSSSSSSSSSSSKSKSSLTISPSLPIIIAPPRLEIGTQRQKFVQDAYGTFPRTSKLFADISAMSDSEIEHLLLENTRHPSNLRPLLRHYIAAQPTKVVVQQTSEVISVPVVYKTVGSQSYKPLTPPPPPRRAVGDKEGEIKLPKILLQSTEFILQSGIDMDGMMKSIPVDNSPKVKNLIQSFDKGFSVVFKNLQDAVGCFFAFLLSLPTPLLPYEMHPYFVSIAEEGSMEQMLESSRNLISTLKEGFQTELLRHLLDFLFQMARRSKFSPSAMDYIGNIIVQLVMGPECCEGDFELAHIARNWTVYDTTVYENFLLIQLFECIIYYFSQ